MASLSTFISFSCFFFYRKLGSDVVARAKDRRNIAHRLWTIHLSSLSKYHPAGHEFFVNIDSGLSFAFGWFYTLILP
jgi:hypothetical protein